MQDRTTVRLPHDLMRRAKRKAAEEGRTLTSLIEDGLRHIVLGEPHAPESRKMPRVSKATGGLRPGVDLTKYSDIQGMDDLEYAKRLKRGFK
jgi:hypothetical protein